MKPKGKHKGRKLNRFKLLLGLILSIFCISLCTEVYSFAMYVNASLAIQLRLFWYTELQRSLALVIRSTSLLCLAPSVAWPCANAVSLACLSDHICICKDSSLLI